MMTKRKKDYADARMRGLNQKDSAMAAGCPEKSAKQDGYRLEKDRDVQAVIGRVIASRKADKPELVEKVPRVKAEKPEPKPAREPKPLPIPDDVYMPAPSAKRDPLEFLAGVMNDMAADPKLRVDAAKALASFTVAKPGEKGKKEMANEKAEKVADKFKVTRLKSVK